MVPDFETAEHTVALANKLISFSQVNDTQHPEYGIYPGGKLIGSINDCGIEENELEIGYVLQGKLCTIGCIKRKALIRHPIRKAQFPITQAFCSGENSCSGSKGEHK